MSSMLYTQPRTVRSVLLVKKDLAVTMIWRIIRVWPSNVYTWHMRTTVCHNDEMGA